MLSLRMRIVHLLVTATVLTACSEGGGPAPIRPDAGRVDFGTIDSGPGTDAGPSEDAGPTEDAGPRRDAGPLVCMTDEITCDGVCVKTDTDVENCGRCGNACAATESCVAGVCAGTACGAGETMCGTACVDTDVDRTNCGDCDIVCAVGETCTAGVCESDCALPSRRCAVDTMTVCLDTSSDDANCGACGNACPTGQSCAASVCGCDMGRTACGATCADVSTDLANCGVCGRSCAAGETCRAGSCRCDTGLTDCTAGCVNTRTDNANCGICGMVCGAGQACSDGTCSSVCASMPGTISCGGACVNPNTSNTHCGGCDNACGRGTTCTRGSCRPVNDLRANALPITFAAAEVTVTGATTNALLDGPTACGCTRGPDVWYRFTLTTRDVVYFDTLAAATDYDSSLYLTDSAGVTLTTTGACNDDSGCTGLFAKSQIAATLNAGTYYVVVSGCGTGAFTLHAQRIADTTSSFIYGTGISGSATSSTVLVGVSEHTPMCTSGPSGEDLYWFTTCGGPQTASLCTSDGGAWQRMVGITGPFDPVLALYSASTGTDIACNDDGGTGCAASDSTLNYGSRLSAVTAPRGLNAFIVDERNQTNGLRYTIQYRITR